MPDDAAPAPVINALLDRISPREEDVTALTQALVRIPTVNPPPRAVRQVLGRPAQFICSPGTYDQKHVDWIGKLKDCIAYGPGVLDLAHKADEWVGIDDMVAAAKVMALSALALLTRERA